MPNNTTSSVVILGEPDKVRAVHDVITEPGRNGQLQVTFAKLIPMPEELHGIVSPTEVAETPEEAAQINADWRATVLGRDGSRRALSRAEYGRLMAQYGATNWYDWSVAHWGTKWDAYDTEVVDLVADETGARLNLQFDTAWSMPRPVFTKLVDDYGVLVLVLWQDEGTEAARFWSGLDAEQRIDAALTVQGFFEDLVWEIFRDSVVSGVRTYYREQVDPA
jgi:hypothetical protein